MSDQELVRSRERETIPGGDYDSLYARREEFTARGMKGDILIKESDRDWSVSRQGHLKFYLLGEVYPDTALQYWYVFVHDIKKQTGKHRHQGGLVLFVIEGEGVTEVNGELIEWEEGDCILLPLHPDGIEHVHFNREDKPAKWLAFIYQPDWDEVASELAQMEVSQDFKDIYGG